MADFTVLDAGGFNSLADIGGLDLLILDERRVVLLEEIAVEICRECHEIDRELVAEEHMGPLLDKWHELKSDDQKSHLGPARCQHRSII